MDSAPCSSIVIIASIEKDQTLQATTGLAIGLGKMTLLLFSRSKLKVASD